MILKQKRKWCKLCEEHWTLKGQLDQKAHLCNHTLEECKHSLSREIGEVIKPKRKKLKRTIDKSKLKKLNSGPKSIVKVCDACGDKERIKYYHITKPVFCNKKLKRGKTCGHQRLVTIKLSKDHMKSLQHLTWEYNPHPNIIIKNFQKERSLQLEVLDSENYKVKQLSKVLGKPRKKTSEAFSIKTHVFKNDNSLKSTDLVSLENFTNAIEEDNECSLEFISPASINTPTAQGKLIEDEVGIRTKNLDFRLKEVQSNFQHPFLGTNVYVKRDGTSENKNGIKVPVEMKTIACMSEMKFSFLDKATNQLAIQALELGVDYGYLIIVSRGSMFSNREFSIVKIKGLGRFHKNHIEKLKQVQQNEQFLQHQSGHENRRVIA